MHQIERFRLVSVKATWNDDSDLRGFYHLEKKSYISTPFLDIIVRANAHPEQLFFVCLDEMNLSRVEYYFSALVHASVHQPPPNPPQY